MGLISWPPRGPRRRKLLMPPDSPAARAPCAPSFSPHRRDAPPVAGYPTSAVISESGSPVSALHLTVIFQELQWNLSVLLLGLGTRVSPLFPHGPYSKSLNSCCMSLRMPHLYRYKCTLEYTNFIIRVQLGRSTTKGQSMNAS
ncbi:hypothetical protein BC629DRAFT_1546464 [Irpex lacteus]|nr:hypothetical protein BC629DRAFT_1546464 [Irpex lacteus]